MSQETKLNASGEELYASYLATGDDIFFEALVSLYEDDLARYLYSIINDFHEAKHLTIEAFAQLAVKGKNFAGKSSLKTYLFTIGKNLARRYLKKRGREQHISFENAVSILADAGDAPYDLLERKDNRRRVQDAMRELREDYRAVLFLLYFDDMSYVEA